MSIFNMNILIPDTPPIDATSPSSSWTLQFQKKLVPMQHVHLQHEHFNSRQISYRCNMSIFIMDIAIPEKTRTDVTCPSSTCQKYFFLSMCDITVSLTFTSLSLGAALTTVLPVLFKYCYKYCYSDSRKL